MPSFMNALGAVSRRGQWRLRRILRASDASGRVDISDDGLLDLSDCSDVWIEVLPRAPHRICAPGSLGEPVLKASLTASTLFVSNPGIVETVFPRSEMIRVMPGLYDVEISVAVGPETERIFCEPVEIF